MDAFTTSCRRAVHFGCVSAVCIACATYVDESPSQQEIMLGDSAGSAGTSGSAGSGAESPLETGGSDGGGGAAAVSGSAGISAVSGSGGLAAGGNAGGSGGGSAGQAGGGSGALGGGGQGGAAGGASGGMGGGGASGGVGGKASGGSAGAGGSDATATCAANPLTAKSKWVVTASSSDAPAPPSQACDNMTATRWTTGKEQAGAEWLQLDFGAAVVLTKLTLVLGTSVDDYPRKYQARFSNSSMNSAAPVLVNGVGAKSTDTVMNFPAGTRGRYLLINQTGVAAALWWSVAEIQAQCAD